MDEETTTDPPRSPYLQSINFRSDVYVPTTPPTNHRKMFLLSRSSVFNTYVDSGHEKCPHSLFLILYRPSHLGDGVITYLTKGRPWTCIDEISNELPCTSQNTTIER